MNTRWVHSLALAGALGVAPLAGAMDPPVPQDEAPSLERDRAYFTDTPLVTQDGEPVRFFSDVLQGRTVVITTIYTNCPGACPLMMEKLKEVSAGFTPEARQQVLFVSISVDPERDTPAKLREFARRMKLPRDNWVLLTGEKTDIDAVVGRLGQDTEDFREHSSLILAGNVPARHWSKIAPYIPARAITARIEQLLAR